MYRCIFTLFSNGCEIFMEKYLSQDICDCCACAENIERYMKSFVIVKLREREGQRVDLGRSLKGHL